MQSDQMTESGQIPCHACGSRKPRQTWTRIGFDVKADRDTEFCSVLKCPDCGAGVIDPFPRADQIAAHYDLEQYYTQNVSHITPVTPHFADKVLSKLAYWADRGLEWEGTVRQAADRQTEKLGPGLSALDIGCGNGDLLEMLQGRGWRAIGIEPDPAARDTAAKKGLNVYTGTAEDMPQEVLNTRFDLISITHVLEHTLDPRQSLINAAARLTPQGVLYCEVPNAACLHFERFHQINEMLDIPRHLHFFGKAALSELAARAGFEILSWHYAGFHRHHSASWRAWENSIRDRIVARAETALVPRHGWWQSAALFARTALAAPERKYDCIGFLARRTTAATG